MKYLDKKMPNGEMIACLGDSITAGFWDEEGLGWVGRLNLKLVEGRGFSYRTLNYGVSGDTTLSGWHNLVSNVPHACPDTLIIMLGVNDVQEKSSDLPGSPYLSLAESLKNWQKILTFSASQGYQILVVGPLPVAGEGVRFAAHDGYDFIPGHDFFFYDQERIKTYNDALERLCGRHKIPFLRLFEDWRSRDTESLLQDGLHPNAAGHQLLAEQVYAKLVELNYVEK